MTADESFCARCARHTTTCCQWREIYVTPGDVERIVAFSGGRDFFEFSRPSDPSYGDQDHDAAWASCVFRADGTRRVLSRWPDGACFFLGAQGCALPAEVRPLVCRLHPFDYDEHGVKDEMLAGCPVHLLPPGQGLIEVLQMSLQDARRWHQQLYEEIRQERSAQCTLV